MSFEKPASPCTDFSTSCRCRHEFCYQCVAKWKTCKCPNWDERHIINNARVPATNIPVAQVLAPHPLPAAVTRPANLPRAAVPNQAAPTPARPVVTPNTNANYPFAGSVAFGAFGSIAAATARANQPIAALTSPRPRVATPQDDEPDRERPRNRRHNRRTQHEHDFERYYRSEGWDTECHKCGHKERWVNCCSDCDLKVCWYCTKYRDLS